MSKKIKKLINKLENNGYVVIATNEKAVVVEVEDGKKLIVKV